MAYFLHTDRPLRPDHGSGYSTRHKAFVDRETIPLAPLSQLHSTADWSYSRPRQTFPGLVETLPFMHPMFNNRGIWSSKPDGIAPSKVALYSSLLPASQVTIEHWRQPWNPSIYPVPGTWAQAKLAQLTFNSFSLEDSASSSMGRSVLPARSQRHVSVSHQTTTNARVENVIGGRKLIFAETLITRHTGKHPRTPFPPASDAGANIESTPIGENVSRKRFCTDVSVIPLEKRRRSDVVDNKLEKSKFLPLATWLASHFNMLLTIQNSTHEPILSQREENAAADRILGILGGYFPQKCAFQDDLMSTVAFLAVWYLGRLFPLGLLRAYDLDQSSAVEVVVRVFLLGLTLANKWLDDFSHLSKKWTRFCLLPISSINLVERTALQMLDYNLSITEGEWHAWLVALKPTTFSFSSSNHGRLIVAACIERALRNENIIKSAGTGPLRSRAEVNCPDSLHRLRNLLLEDTKKID